MLTARSVILLYRDCVGYIAFTAAV